MYLNQAFIKLKDNEINNFKNKYIKNNKYQ